MTDPILSARRELAKRYAETGTDVQFRKATFVLESIQLEATNYSPTCRHQTTMVTVAGAVLCCLCWESL